MKILVAAWGDSYIRRFADLGLASMAAPRNLPAVEARWDVEFVFLTAAADVDAISDLSLWRALPDVRRRFVPIDDLIVPGIFTVTLTLAYMRGVRTFADTMTGTHFLFWNADFVLSDGAYSHIADLMDEGRAVILSGSIRGVDEEVRPRLMRQVDPSGRLALSGAALTRLALDHPHPLQDAKTVNRAGVWAEHPNHMFWTAGPDAIVARYWQIFMLCLKPTRRIEAIDGYCDYSFTPALCPGEPLHVIGDSDDVCLLELQGRDQAHEPVHRGPGRNGRWTQSIREWCTPEHLEVARRPILFHAAAPTPEVDAVIRTSAKVVEDFATQVGDRPTYQGHYYWIAGVTAWDQRRPPSAGGVAPPELDDRLPVAALSHPSFTQPFQRASASAKSGDSLISRLRIGLVGDAARPGRLHPDRTALSLLSAAARDWRGAKAGGLVVAVPGTWLHRIFPPHLETWRHMDLAGTSIWRLAPDPPLDDAMIYLRRGDGVDVAYALRSVLGAMRPGGLIRILAHDPAYQAGQGWLAKVEAAIRQGALASAVVSKAGATAAEVRWAKSLLDLLVAGVTWRRLVSVASGALGAVATAAGRSKGEPTRDVAVVIEVTA